MSQRDELDLILSLIKRYSLPLSPILEYAINEKKEALSDDVSSEEESASHTVYGSSSEENSKLKVEPEISHSEEEATIVLTKEIIEAARTPNGGFTKSQLSAVGVAWPPSPEWIEEKVGEKITPSQLTAFNHIEYVAKATYKPVNGIGTRTYRDVTSNPEERKKMEAILQAMTHFVEPATPRDIARTISRTAWGGGMIREDTVDSFLKRLPEVEYIKWGKYILKSRI